MADALSAWSSQQRLMGTGTDGELNIGVFCLIVDVASSSSSFLIREDLCHIWSREKLTNWALLKRTLLVSLFKCLKWIFRSAFPYTLNPHNLSKLSIKENFQVSFAFNFVMKAKASKSEMH